MIMKKTILAALIATIALFGASHQAEARVAVSINGFFPAPYYGVPVATSYYGQPYYQPAYYVPAHAYYAAPRYYAPRHHHYYERDRHHGRRDHHRRR
jgi:hypothetical protein